MNRDALSVSGQDYPDVEYLLVDPSCTGSGNNTFFYIYKILFSDHYYWIFKSYLQDRCFQVRVENEFSQYHLIHSGVPQGSILIFRVYCGYTKN